MLKNFFPILVSTFKLKGGYVTLIFLLVFFLGTACSWYYSSSAKLLCLRADTYACFKSRKDLLSLDRLLSRLETMSGMLLTMLFGWLDILLIYRGVVRLFVGSVRFVTYIEREVQEVYVIVT